ncbi:MAG TPA: leucyl aminopeptidase family protein [Xanthobacteraceae bacterium]|nr:leucyl aminopeptidase family protein [Xanthobacteraceae bacterium]
MHPAFVIHYDGTAVPIWFASTSNWRELRRKLKPQAVAYADAAGFEPKPSKFVLLPDQNGGIDGAVFAIEGRDEKFRDPFLPGLLPDLLPPGTYKFANRPHDARLAALAFALGSYRFNKYGGAAQKQVRLVLPDGVEGEDLSRIAEGVTLARDLINTPANDMGPAELEAAARDLAARHAASVTCIVGDDLLKQNFPLIHAVGRAAARAPRLIDLQWGDPGHPKVTLVGKGVCFDTGGLDIKPSGSMQLMKKDMGGAATVLALAHMLMDRGTKVRLRVLIPAVENAVSANAFRPLDVYRARAGITVEVGNTDAEGRLILADALAAADAEKPDFLIDLGTLTGAARVALGPDLPAFYTDSDEIAAEVASHATAENDPVWRLPLWPPYKSMLESKIADISNDAGSRFAGSITCALFLQRFVAAASVWLHFDIFAWTPKAKPGRPEGGECQAARALYALLAARYG